MKVSGEIRGSIYESVLYRRSVRKCGPIFARDSGGKTNIVPTRARKSACGAEAESRKSVCNLEESLRKSASGVKASSQRVRAT